MADKHGGPGSGLDLDGLTEELDARLKLADNALARRFPGEPRGRQPVHTLYVPADRFHDGVVAEYGQWALMSVDGNEATLLELLEGDEAVLDRVRSKLEREPVEDLRIDFEDGYGTRPDAEEDAAVLDAARALRAAIEARTAPPFHGIRFKSFEKPTRRRGVRTLAMFLEELTGGQPVPDGFVVTLPKVTSVEQVEAMVHACERLETGLGLVARSLRFELQIETPQAILGPDGTALVARMIHAAAGRVTGLHYGTYDYSASCGIAGEYQSLEHPVADHAKAVMQAAAAGTGVRLSDGSTNVLPVGDGQELRAAWANHLRLVRRSLERGFYQGWDLHPAQLPTRYAAVYSFYRRGYRAAAQRLRDWTEQTGGGVLDEPATARALADFLARGTDCGALAPDEVTAASGLGPDQVAQLARRNGGES